MPAMQPFTVLTSIVAPLDHTSRALTLNRFDVTITP